MACWRHSACFCKKKAKIKAVWGAEGIGQILSTARWELTLRSLISQGQTLLPWQVADLDLAPIPLGLVSAWGQQDSHLPPGQVLLLFGFVRQQEVLAVLYLREIRDHPLRDLDRRLGKTF